jgi:peptidoglycan biosynthesis protein MviN/MurJ (putative lipid II flippase)
MHVESYYHAWNLSDASFPGGIALGEAGLALATCLTAIADTAILALALRKRLVPALAADFRADQFAQLWQTALRMVIAAAALGVLTWLFRNSIPYDPRFWRLLQRGVIPCLLAGGAFYIIGIVLPLPEMKEFLTSPFRRR